MCLVAYVLGSLLVSSARAQEPAPLPPFGPGWQEGLQWRDVGPRSGSAFADVAADGAVVVAVDVDGTVWWSRDGGRSWRGVLRAEGSALGDASIDERALLDAESRLDELTGDLDVDATLAFDDDEALDELLDEQEDAMQQAIDALVDELPSDALGGGWFTEIEEVVAPVPPRVWVRDGEGLVSRADGVWRSRDGGASWTLVRSDPLAALVRLPDGRWVAGDGDGVVVSSDLDVWERPTQALSAVEDLAPFGGGLVAVSADGLLVSDDGLSWTRLGDARRTWDVVRALGTRLILGDDDGVRWSDDGGRMFETPVGPPLGGVRDLLVLGTETVLVAGELGVWVSRDAGESWLLLAEGNESAASGLAVSGGRILVAGDGGLLALEAAASGVLGAVADADFPDAALLLDAALGRLGLAAPRVAPAQQVARWLLPQFALELRWRRGDVVASRLDAGQTQVADGELGVFGWLQWRPPSQLSGGGGQQVVVEETPDGPQFYAGAFDSWMLLGAVGRQAVDERVRTTRTVSDLISNRDVLLQERARGGAGLREQVELTMRIAEIDAWLDAMTDGALSRYRAGRATGGTP